jgi:GT2 family glycosyltransferase
MSSTFLIVVVIYERDFEDSQTCQSIFKAQVTASHFPEVLIYDNSVKSKYDEKYSKNIAHYKHDPDNSGVGGAYNYAASLAGSTNKDGLILFDQDTKIDEDYFKQLEHSVREYHGENLFCPNVSANNKIISPARYFGFRRLVLVSQKRVF